MKKSISILLVITMLMTLMIPVLTFTVTAADEPAPVNVAQSGVSYYDGTPTTDWYGDGSAIEFVLDSASDLYGLAQLVNGGNTFSGKTVKLTTDVVINGGDVDDFGAPGYDTSSLFAWEPIGKSATVTFSGTFDGDGHVVSGLFVSKVNTDYVGFFGSAINATVKNVLLLNSYVASSAGAACDLSQGVGSIAGYGKNLVIQNCYSDALIADGGMLTGGIVGYAITASKVEGCVFAGEVRADGRGVGGICGGSDNGGMIIINCINVAMVTNYHGATKTGIQTCHNKASFTGGIIGQLKNDADVTYCVNIGNVVSPNHTDYKGSPNGGTVYTPNAFNENTIAGIGEAATSTVDYCYVIQASDAVSGGKTPWIGHQYTATLGSNNGYIESAAAINGVAAEMAMPHLDWDTAWVTVDGSFPMPKTVAGYVANATKDYTAANPNQPAGLGADHWNGGVATGAWTVAPEADGKYHIRRASDLAAMASLVNITTTGFYFTGATVVLDTDIVWNEGNADTWTTSTTGLHSWTRIGTSWDISFKGTFDGQGHDVSGIYYVASDNKNVGFFGYLVNGTACNLSITNSFFSNPADKAGDGMGALAARARDAHVYNIYSDAIMNRVGWCQGGLIGYLRATSAHASVVENCVFNGKIYTVGNSGVGGIIGATQGTGAAVTIKNCINLGSVDYNVTAKQCGAGIIGAVQAKDGTIIQNCINLGDVPTCAALLGSDKWDGGSTTVTAIMTNNYYLSGQTATYATNNSEFSNHEISAASAIIGANAKTALTNLTWATENTAGWVVTDYYPMPSETVAKMYIDSLVKLEAVQESDIKNGTYDVRFIASISAEDWVKAGFEFVISYDGEGTEKDFANAKKTWYVENAYTGINAKNDAGVNMVAIDAEAGEYLIAATAFGVYEKGTATFVVNAFVIDAKDNKVVTDTVTVTYVDGAFISAVNA